MTLSSKSATARRLAALALAVLWLVGFELVPNLHVGFHEAFGHHHHGEAAHASAEGEAAHHDDTVHEHADDEHHHAHPHGDTGEGHGHHADHHDHPAEADHHDHHAAAEPSRGDTLEEPPQEEPPASGLAACATTAPHGRHSLAHRGVAAVDPPAAEPSLPWLALPATDYAHLPVGVPKTRQPETTRARGPPRA